MSLREKVLVIGAHPDDVELGCAGFLQDCNEFVILVLSNGENGCEAENRKIEAEKAAIVLDAKIQVYDLEDMRIDVVLAANIIEEWIKTFCPDLILTMSKADVHQDHQATYAATKIAIRNSTSTVLSYISPSSAQDFHPNWFISITKDQMKIKLKALKCHYSQHDRSYFADEYVIGMARYWAMVTRSKSEYVEPFTLIRHWGSK